MDGWMTQFNVTFTQADAKQASRDHSNEVTAIESYINEKFKSNKKICSSTKKKNLYITQWRIQEGALGHVLWEH